MHGRVRYNRRSNCRVAVNDGSAVVASTRVDAANGHAAIYCRPADEQSVDMTKAANNGLSGMHVACKHGHIDIVSAMLQHDESIKDVTSPDGRTPYVEPILYL